MTVSGLGSARTQQPYAHGVTRTGRAERHTRAGNDFDQLTESDRELIYSVTGQRVSPGFDVEQEPPTRFAATIAADRATGRLTAGQEVTAVYLKDVHQQYERAGATSPVAEHLDAAVAYLARIGARRIDVTA